MKVPVRPAARFRQQFVGKRPFVWPRVRSDEAAKGLVDLEGQSVSERQAINDVGSVGCIEVADSEG